MTTTMKIMAMILKSDFAFCLPSIRRKTQEKFSGLIFGVPTRDANVGKVAAHSVHILFVQTLHSINRRSQGRAV
jgi:hypothetical protein